MPYLFADSFEAKRWLRDYAARHGWSWDYLKSKMNATVHYSPKVGSWVQFATMLKRREELEAPARPQALQKTLKPQFGPMLQMLNNIKSEEELRDFLATMLFDDIVQIATAVKQKRSSRGKSTRTKAKAVQEREPEEGDGTT